MVGKLLLGMGALVMVAAAAGAGAGCSVKADGGSGGAGGTTNSSTAAVGVGGMKTTASGTTCMENPGCKKCKDCVTGCGVAANNDTVCKCNAVGMGKASLDSYSDYYGCLCASSCGAKCSKTCTGTGTDASDCMTCLASKVGTDCKTQYTACTMN